MKNRSTGTTLYGAIIILVGVLICLRRGFLIAPVFFITGIGILQLKPFARYWAFATATLGIMHVTLAMYKIVMMTKTNPNAHAPYFYFAIGLVLSSLFCPLYASIFYYFTRPEVKEQFKEPNGERL